MYKYSTTTKFTNFAFFASLVVLGLFITSNLMYKIVILLFSALILKDAIKEMFATFEVTGQSLLIKSRDKVVKEIKYSDMLYLTITRKNKRWIVIADDNGILFTIKPRIENYQEMVADLIEKNKSNKKLEVHDYIKKTYKR